MITGYSNIISVTTLPGLLLDLYPSAAAAYSVRKLRSAYTGNAIRVRRSSDNTEQDIGFDLTGNLDTSALTTFCSGTNGFVTTWYDQSGNANNSVQTTAANQPQIISAGSVILKNSKPSVEFDGSNDNFLLSSSIATTNSTYSIFDISTYTISSLGTSNTILGGNVGSIQLRYADIINFDILRTQQLGIISDNSRSINIQYLNSSFTKNTGNKNYANNILKVSNATNPAFSSAILNIGSSRGNLEFMRGTIQEVIIYTSDQLTNVSAINTNINTYYGIY